MTGNIPEELKTLTLEERIKEYVATWPLPTPEQRDRLAALLDQRGCKQETPLQYVYVILFSTGTIKVGCSTRPNERIKQHAASARVMGAEIEDKWVSKPIKDMYTVERDLIQYGQLYGERISKEWFNGLDFDDTVDFAKSVVAAS